MLKFNPLLLSKMDVFKYNQLLAVCETKNKTEALQIIEQINTNKESNNIIETVFHCACFEGKLDLAQFIFNICPSINVSCKNEYAFRIAVINNHTDVCKWLLAINPKINVDIFKGILYEKFWEFCTIGDKENAKWLFHICPSVDKFINHCLYIVVCANNHISVAKWLTKVKQYYFILDLNDDETKIMNYSVRDVGERKWLERRVPILAHDMEDGNLFARLPHDVVRYICGFI